MYRHETADRNCAYWDGTRLSFLSRMVLGIRCRICSNVGTALGATINPPELAGRGSDNA